MKEIRKNEKFIGCVSNEFFIPVSGLGYFLEKINETTFAKYPKKLVLGVGWCTSLIPEEIINGVAWYQWES